MVPLDRVLPRALGGLPHVGKLVHPKGPTGVAQQPADRRDGRGGAGDDEHGGERKRDLAEIGAQEHAGQPA